MRTAHFPSLKLGAGALALLLALPAFASSAAAPALAEHHAHGVAWVSGGIGADESSALKSEASSYPLSMVFSAGKHDEYLADVRVVVKDHAGKTVLNTVSAGPLMLVRLPAGDYRVSAASDGRTLQRDARVAGHGDTQVSFHWPTA